MSLTSASWKVSVTSPDSDNLPFWVDFNSDKIGDVLSDAVADAVADVVADVVCDVVAEADCCDCWKGEKKKKILL